MQTLNFTCKIQSDEGVNPLHLCEEIQAYLNSYSDSKVVGYNLEVEKLTPFYAKDEY